MVAGMKKSNKKAVNPSLIKDAEAIFKKCGPLFFALGDDTRQEILTMLTDAGNDGMNVSDITQRLNLSRPTVSHHLKILKEAGFLEVSKNGTHHYYSLSVLQPFTMIKELVDMMDLIVREAYSN